MRSYSGGLSPKLHRMVKIVQGYPQRIDSHEGWEQEQMTLDFKMYQITTSFLEGDALDVLESVEEGFGVEVWRQLHKDGEPKAQGHYRTRLMQVLDPKLPGESYRKKIRK